MAETLEVALTASQPSVFKAYPGPQAVCMHEYISA